MGGLFVVLLLSSAGAISVYILKRANKITITFAYFIKKYKYSTFSYTTKLTKDWKAVLLLKHLQEKVDSKSLHISSWPPLENEFSSAVTPSPKTTGNFHLLLKKLSPLSPHFP